MSQSLKGARKRQKAKGKRPGSKHSCSARAGFAQARHMVAAAAATIHHAHSACMMDTMCVVGSSSRNSSSSLSPLLHLSATATTVSVWERGSEGGWRTASSTAIGHRSRGKQLSKGIQSASCLAFSETEELLLEAEWLGRSLTTSF